MSDTIAVNSKELVKDISSLETQYENVSKAFNDMSNIVSRMSSYCEGNILDTIKYKYSQFESQFPAIKNNLESYIEDLKKVSTGFDTLQSSVSTSEVNNLEEGGELVHVNN